MLDLALIALQLLSTSIFSVLLVQHITAWLWKVGFSSMLGLILTLNLMFIGVTDRQGEMILSFMFASLVFV